MEVKFEFELDEKVITWFGNQGIIIMAGRDQVGNLYYVKTKEGSDWFREDHLRHE